MARPKSENVQINISIPAEWKKEFENLGGYCNCEILYNVVPKLK